MFTSIASYLFSLPVCIVRKTRFLSGFGSVDLISSAVATFQKCNFSSFAANAWRQSAFVYEGCKCCQIRRLASREEGETHEYLTKKKLSLQAPPSDLVLGTYLQIDFMLFIFLMEILKKKILMRRE